MTLLKNKTIEKLAKEGRISKTEDPRSPKHYQEINQSLITQDFQMYKYFQNSKRVSYSQIK